jgi:formate dehydrogenase subunit beta
VTTAQGGAVFPAEGGVEEGILDCIRQALGKGCFDAVLVPVKVPAGDSFAYVLVQDEALLEDAHPLSPIMPVQGARALSSITRLGKGRTRIGAIMRPCEVRATIELSKLEQVELEHVTLISIDCPGVLPLADWVRDQGKSEDAFKGLLERWDCEAARPVCRICDEFSTTGGEDLHIGTLRPSDSNILLIPRSPKGEAFLDQLGISPKEDISGWTSKVNELTKERRERRPRAQKEFETKIAGLDNLLDAFGNCINCHNCMRVCPICYCRQCFFDSDKLNFTFEDYLTRAEKQGGLRFPPETLLFHIGRMVHMSLSCVSCGACEDACPMLIPVSQIFSLVADRNQAAFDYHPGRNREESLPLRFYQEEELEEVEDSYAGISVGEEARDA